MRWLEVRSLLCLFPKNLQIYKVNFWTYLCNDVAFPTPVPFLQICRSHSEQSNVPVPFLTMKMSISKLLCAHRIWETLQIAAWHKIYNLLILFHNLGATTQFDTKMLFFLPRLLYLLHQQYSWLKSGRLWQNHQVTQRFWCNSSKYNSGNCAWQAQIKEKDWEKNKERTSNFTNPHHADHHWLIPPYIPNVFFPLWQ